MLPVHARTRHKEQAAGTARPPRAPLSGAHPLVDARAALNCPLAMAFFTVSMIACGSQPEAPSGSVVSLRGSSGSSAAGACPLACLPGRRTAARRRCLPFKPPAKAELEEGRRWGSAHR